MPNRYVARLFNKAFSDTVGFFGWNRRSLVLPIAGFAGMGTRWAISGWDVVAGDITATVFYVLAPVGAVTIALFLYNLIRAPDRLQAACEARAAELSRSLDIIRNKQDKVDHLSGLLSEGISKIWNTQIDDESGLVELTDTWEQWQEGVVSYLRNNFNRADLDHFCRLGVVPIVGRPGAYRQNEIDDRHAKILREYALKEARLREIIRDHNVTHVKID